MGGGRRDREGSALKTVAVVGGGLVLAWLAVETAFKPFLDHLRGAISGSDPTRDPDEAADGATPAKEVVDDDDEGKEEE